MALGISDSGIVIGAGRTERAIAIDVVREFLDALGRRDLAAASAYLAPGFVMTLPGNHQFRKLEYQVAGSLVELKLPYETAGRYAEEMVA